MGLGKEVEFMAGKRSTKAQQNAQRSISKTIIVGEGEIQREQAGRIGTANFSGFGNIRIPMQYICTFSLSYSASDDDEFKLLGRDLRNKDR